jgi:hypothetical protein
MDLAAALTAAHKNSGMIVHGRRTTADPPNIPPRAKAISGAD